MANVRLRSIYLQQISDKEKQAYLFQCISRYLEGLSCNLLLEEAVKKSSGFESKNLFDFLNAWRDLLSLALIAKSSGSLASIKNVLQERVSTPASYVLWEDLPLLKALKGGVSALLELPLAAPDLSKESEGFPIESTLFLNWAEISQTPWNAEVGVLYYLIGHLTGDLNWNQAGLRIANWQLNTLSFDFYPLSGIYSFESNGSVCNSLVWNYLLFLTSAKIMDQPHLASAAFKQMSYLEEISCSLPRLIPPLALILENRIEALPSREEAEFCLNSFISTAKGNLLGLRNPSYTVLCTTVGGKTGLGAIKAGDAQIVNYGPQTSPLGDCHCFGIEAETKRHNRFHSFSLSPRDKHFRLSKRVRLAAKPRDGLLANEFENGCHSLTWVDIQQSFASDKLHIDAVFFGFEDNQPLYFSFFASAHVCGLEDGRILKPCSFDRYQGKNQKVYLKSQTSQLAVDRLTKEASMQIIPLAGGENFWGANFLIAYEIEGRNDELRWLVEISAG